MTVVEFKTECNDYCYRALNFYCFDDNDSYDLECLVDTAIKNNQSPKEFVTEHFYDDLAELEYHYYLEEESHKHMMEDYYNET
jgi:hypothetical protein